MRTRGAQFGELHAQSGVGWMVRIEGGETRAGIAPSAGDGV
ncbi:hypothetical protein [Methylocystis sp.]|nr:hypothetical protein [Methylocystis sp.]